MSISKEHQERLNYEEKIWNEINKEKDCFNLKQSFYHFKLEVMDKLRDGEILCNCGEKATVYGLSLFMCSRCDKDMADSMVIAHTTHDPNDESMSWNYS